MIETQAITCPWCGTNYAGFQSNCDNCGGSLPLPAEQAVEPLDPRLPSPPAPPREVPQRVAWRILITDGWAIIGFVFSLIGLIFSVVGFALTITLVGAFVGIPFAGMGILFLGSGGPLLVWRFQLAQKTVEVLRNGVAVLGEISNVYQNFQVQVNGRYPWTVEYRCNVNGQAYQGKVTTLSQPDLSQQPGKAVYVLYLKDDPAQNTIYPNPYGYFGL